MKFKELKNGSFFIFLKEDGALCNKKSEHEFAVIEEKSIYDLRNEKILSIESEVNDLDVGMMRYPKKKYNICQKQFYTKSY